MDKLKKAWANYLAWRQKNYKASGMGEEAFPGAGISKDQMMGLIGLGSGIRLFRGIPKWFKGSTIVDDMVVGGGGKHWTGQQMSKRNLFTSTKEDIADNFAGKKGVKFKFDVPEEYIKKYATSEQSYLYPGEMKYSFKKGLPTKFIEKIYGLKSKK